MIHRISHKKFKFGAAYLDGLAPFFSGVLIREELTYAVEWNPGFLGVRKHHRNDVPTGRFHYIPEHRKEKNTRKVSISRRCHCRIPALQELPDLNSYFR
jgi:hypothetical protein